MKALEEFTNSALPSGNLARNLDQQVHVFEEPNNHPESSDWLWQLKNRITSFEVLSKLIKLTPEEKEGFKNPRAASPWP